MEAQDLIIAYRTGFYLCAAVAVLGLMLSVTLFMRFKIPTIWAVRTGRAEKQAVRELQEKGKREGQMRKSARRRTTIREEAVEKIKKTDALSGSSAETEVLPQNEKEYGSTGDLGYGETKDLQPAYSHVEKQAETTVLQSKVAETTVLTREERIYGITDDLGFGTTATLEETEAAGLNDFVVTQQEMVVYTEEKIPDEI